MIHKGQSVDKVGKVFQGDAGEGKVFQGAQGLHTVVGGVGHFALA